MEGKVSNATILHAIGATLLCGLFFLAIELFLIPDPFLCFGIALVYCLIHPVIGKLWSLAVEDLSDQIDELYELKEDHKWGQWGRETRILFGAWWPFTGPIMILVTGIGIVFGHMYKKLF